MTGFGRAVAESGPWRVQAEIGSVNRKQLEINVTLPAGFLEIERAVRDQVRARVSRGQVHVTLTVMDVGLGGSGQVSLDRALAARCLAEWRAFAEEQGLDATLRAGDLMAIPGLWTDPAHTITPETFLALAEAAVDQALAQFLAARRREGESLAVDLRTRLDHLRTGLEAAAGSVPNLPAQYRERLEARLTQLGWPEITEDERVWKEVALAADRMDVSEELARIRSHLDQMTSLLNRDEPVGRPLDFLCQELFREWNTLGNKAGHLDVTRQALEAKAVIEQLREQVQNLE